MRFRFLAKSPSSAKTQIIVEVRLHELQVSVSPLALSKSQMATARNEKHRYGQHYTPLHVARLLAALAVRTPVDLVLDPSCGDGRILESALALKRALALKESNSSDLSAQVFGVERSSDAVSIAKQTGACVAAADFFAIAPGTTLDALSRFPLEFNALIGNPPYIRQELIGAEGKRLIEAQLARDRVASPEIFWPRWSRRSDIYVYFFAHSIRFLADRGRIAYLTASSWLDAGYGAALREFLLANFRVIAVIESAAESFFADASINTCITLLERESNRHELEHNSVKFVRFNRALDEVLDEYRNENAENAELYPEWHLAKHILDANFSSDRSHRARCIAQSDLSRSEFVIGKLFESSAQGWGKFLRADEVFFNILKQGRSSMLSLSDVAKVRFGVKTGANEFFYFREDTETTAGKKTGVNDKTPDLLTLGTVASVRRGITTGANEFFYLNNVDQAEIEVAEDHSAQDFGCLNGKLTTVRDSTGRLLKIESELLRPVVFSLKEITAIEIDRVKPRRLLFDCSLTPEELEGTEALEYIRSGEQAGFHLRPTCSNREPWYSAARGMKPAPLIFPSKVGERWLVALNRARVYEDKKLYGVFPRPGVSVLMLAALLNSTWSRYYAEVTCRQMTGAQAIADIDVVVAENIMLPDPQKLSASLKQELETALLQLSRRPVLSFFDEIDQADRRRLDLLTLEAIGFHKGSECAAVIDDLYCAVSELIRARLSK